MKFRDIVNRDLVNLTNCESEPIHIPGSIQPHGFLLALKAADLTIDFCSANSFELIGLRHEQLLGKSFEVVFGKAITAGLNHYISLGDQSYVAPFEVEFAGSSFTCAVQSNAEMVVIEFESATTQHIEVADIYQQTKQFTAYLEKADSLRMLCQLVADETRAITGYDRVMIYKFDEGYNGEVFAESRIDSVEPFLGLHYPHTDIPAQARELYIKNLLRLIVDVNYTPVPIFTIDDAPNKNLDLSLSTLRSVSPIHIQYLHNMGVGATLTISLMHEERLWGLIACHHYSPKYISRNTRIAAQLQGHFLTSQIEVRQGAEEYAVARKVNKSLDEMMSKLFSSDTMSFEEIISQQELLSLTNANSVIMVVDDEIYSQGSVLPDNELKELINLLETCSFPIGFSTSNLTKISPGASKWASLVSGVVYHKLGGGANNCIMWCRGEALQEVSWAGNPEKAIIKDEKGLSPRKSFELWKEVKKCESHKWLKPELVAASNFAHAMEKHVHMIFLSKEEEKYRRLSEKLKEANAELEHLNWIGTHDLKEPLRKIQMFASQVLDDENEMASGLVIESVKRMRDSAQRMQTLIGDIMAYSKLNHIEDDLEPIDLKDVAASVTRELESELQEQNAVLEISDLPTIKGIPFLLRQLFSNLLRNSLKFSNAGTNPHITVDYNQAEQFTNDFPSGELFHKIMVSDNGIGFDNQYKESIFKVFTRLHNNTEYSGSGVGLALCKKIMQSHNGYIAAEGTPGAGATFSLHFPMD